MDIKTLFTKETDDVEIVHPKTGEKAGLVITVYARHSEQYERAFARYVAAGENRIRARFLADITVGWEGAELAGKPYEFSEDNALELYKKSGAIASQVDLRLAEADSFLLDA